MMTISFAGQAVVITGAGGGLGSTYAKEIARRGGMVVVNDLGGPTTGAEGETATSFADSVVEEIRAAGGQAVANYDTVATPEGGQAIIDAALSAFGRIDAVIANAGNMRYGAFEKLSFADLQSLLTVHIGGTWNVAQAAWPHFKARNYGRLVCTCSSTGMFGAAGLAAYAAAKGGVMGLMHALANAGADHGILANAVMPNAMSRMTSTMVSDDVGGRPNPWAGAMPQFFDPAYTTGLATYLASDACHTNHGIYSACMGRIGKAFVGVTNGVIDDERPTADQIAERWAVINDHARGYVVAEEVSEEWRHVAELRGIEV
ncbi:MAG: SDR family NAD(P)-dependent oxidoreductase [Sphingomonadales bacterium]|nr:SDR family NAD(P)-dependent oxidoreductase [Sphingomonadales bacterium]